MLAAILLAATLPLGVWPPDVGPAASVVDDVELYVVEPEDDYFIVAVEPLSPPLSKAEPAALKRLASLAQRLGADGVVPLAELAEKDIPDDPDESLPQGRRFTAAVFVSFDTGADQEQGPTLTRLHAHRGARRTSVNSACSSTVPSAARRARITSKRCTPSISTTSGANAATGISAASGGRR